MLGTVDYDISWSKKMDFYESYFPNQLIKTYENGALSKDAQKLIDKLKKVISPFATLERRIIYQHVEHFALSVFNSL